MGHSVDARISRASSRTVELIQDVGDFALCDPFGTNVPELLVEGQFLVAASAKSLFQLSEIPEDVRRAAQRDSLAVPVADLLVNGQFFLGA